VNRGERGQAAVELALCLPLIAALTLLVVQVGLLVRDQVLVTEAARAAAREAAVSSGPGEGRRAAERSVRLDHDRLEVDIGRRGAVGTPIRVTVRYRAPTDVPLVGPLLGDVRLSDSATMRIER
jgi:hypothetical protein